MKQTLQTLPVSVPTQYPSVTPAAPMQNAVPALSGMPPTVVQAQPVPAGTAQPYGAPQISRQPHPQAQAQIMPQMMPQGQPIPRQHIQAPVGVPVQQAPHANPAYPQAPAVQQPIPQQQVQPQQPMPQIQVQQHVQPQAQVQAQPQAQVQAQAPAQPLGQAPQDQHGSVAGYTPTQMEYGQNPLTQQAVQPIDPMKDGGERPLPRIAIHAFCDRNETAGVVQAMTGDWRMARANLKVYMGGLPAAAEYYKNESTPSLIMVESSLRGEALFEQLEALASVVDEGTKVVLVGVNNDIRLYRELMEKGLSDYIVPPFHPINFIRSISDLYSDPDQPFTGRIVAFFGAKGGVGSSTLSHNVAWALANNLDQETSLIDLDSSWGTTGLDFNYDSTQGLEEALSETERLDEALLDKIMVRHTEKLSILPASSSLGGAAPSDPEAYAKLIDGVRSLSPLSIIDMPHVWTEWSRDILTSAEDVVITATPDLANLRNTKNLVDFLKGARPNDNPPLLILNKTGVPKTAEIPVKDFAAAVGIEPSLVLAYEPVVFTEASNDGKMLSDINGATSAYEGLMYLATRLRTGKFQDVERSKKGLLGLGKKKRSAPTEAGTTNQDGGSSKESLLSKLTKRK